MQLSDDQIREIAGNMDVGMRSFYHLKTGKIEAIPDFEPLKEIKSYGRNYWINWMKIGWAILNLKKSAWHPNRS
ncbi:MAG: hypothetical protein ACXIUQ_12090 [Cecembia sp.]